MTVNRSILEYPRPKTWPPRELLLEELDGGVRVTFAARPLWHYTIGIVGSAVGGVMDIVVAVFVAITSRNKKLSGMRGHSMYELLDPQSRRLVDCAIAVLIISGFLYLFASVVAYRKYRRWGRVPRTIVATEEWLIHVRLGRLRLREQFIPVNEVQSIVLRRIRFNLTPRLTIRRLTIRLRHGRLRFRLSSRDPQLPARIAERLADILGCPLDGNGA